MIAALLIALQLVAASDFVVFRICYLETSAMPWEFRPHPDSRLFYVRPEQILTVTDPNFHHLGIECVRVCAAYGCKFVIGTAEGVIERLEGGENAAD